MALGRDPYNYIDHILLIKLLFRDLDNKSGNILFLQIKTLLHETVLQVYVCLHAGVLFIVDSPFFHIDDYRRIYSEHDQ